MPVIQQQAVLKHFSCLGDKCPDTCCRGWSMQLDLPTEEKYQTQAPELLDAVTTDDSGLRVMRRDANDACVKFEDGLCGIHKSKGSDFLGDACHFYPRVTRKLGNTTLMTAMLSCPETVRLAITENMWAPDEVVEVERLPHIVKNYLPEGMAEEDAISVHRFFLEKAGDVSSSAEINLLKLYSVARALQRIEPKDWKGAAQVYWNMAEGFMPPAETKAEDPFNIFHALVGLLVASRKKRSQALYYAVDCMQKSLKVAVEWENAGMELSNESTEAANLLYKEWHAIYKHAFTPVFHSWLTLQLSSALFPFAGFGTTLTDRLSIIGVRLTTLKLALMSISSIGKSVPPQDVVVQTIHSLSRALDHLADPAFSLQIYSETGWLQEGRLRGLLEA